MPTGLLRLPKWRRIKVEDAPFLAVELNVTNDDDVNTLNFRTNSGRWVAADAAHPIRVDIDPDTHQPRPYLQVAEDGTEARINRAVFLRTCRDGRTSRYQW